MEDLEQLNPETLSDFKDLPPRSQRAAFAGGIRPLWPKNEKGKRVKPRGKSKSKSKRRAKTTTKRKATRKRSYSRSSGLTKSQKWGLGLAGAGIITWMIVKRPI